jgi:hypothetical protein
MYFAKDDYGRPPSKVLRDGNARGAALPVYLALIAMVQIWRDRPQKRGRRQIRMDHNSPGGALPLLTLVPFADEERISIGEAAAIAGKSERMMRYWCVEHGIGRRIAGGVWAVSKVALAMLLDGDIEALAAYRDRGARASSEPVARYYRRCDLADLLERPGFAA